MQSAVENVCLFNMSVFLSISVTVSAKCCANVGLGVAKDEIMRLDITIDAFGYFQNIALSFTQLPRFCFITHKTFCSKHNVKHSCRFKFVVPIRSRRN